MSKIDLLKMLDDIDENKSGDNSNNRYLLIDALNLFFRNFSAINSVNPHGTHIGGLGGFFRSLGFLIKTISPTHVYILFDGIGGSHNRKNILPEYKSGRNAHRITNWDVFESLEEEDDAKVNQLTRIIQYLKHLPIKTISLPKVEADDIIAFLSPKLAQNNDKVYIVSSDKDYLQLINENITVYRPIEREFYTEQIVKEKFNLLPHNFILYKLLMGDNSDKISGIKGLGHKKLIKLFPELQHEKLELEDILKISESKLTENVIYARILHDIELLENKYRIMDLSKPMITEDDEKVLMALISSPTPKFNPDNFLKLCTSDQLEGLIKNPNVWVQETFGSLK